MAFTKSTGEPSSTIPSEGVKSSPITFLIKSTAAPLLAIGLK
jgi:hypothetical protein